MNFAAFLSVASALAGGIDAPAPTQFTVRIELKRGDPFGCREAGNLETLSACELAVGDQQGGSFEMGNPHPLPGASKRFRFTAASVGDGKVRLSGEAELLTSVEAKGEESIVKGDRVAFSRVLAFNESTRIKHAGAPVWWEVSVRVEDALHARPALELAPAPTTR